MRRQRSMMARYFEILDFCSVGAFAASSPLLPPPAEQQKPPVPWPSGLGWYCSKESQFSTFECLYTNDIKREKPPLMWQGRGMEGKQDKERVASITKNESRGLLPSSQHTGLSSELGDNQVAL